MVKLSGGGGRPKYVICVHTLFDFAQSIQHGFAATSRQAGDQVLGQGKQPRRGVKERSQTMLRALTFPLFAVSTVE